MPFRAARSRFGELSFGYYLESPRGFKTSADIPLNPGFSHSFLPNVKSPLPGSLPNVLKTMVRFKRVFGLTFQHSSGILALQCVPAEVSSLKDVHSDSFCCRIWRTHKMRCHAVSPISCQVQTPLCFTCFGRRRLIASQWYPFCLSFFRLTFVLEEDPHLPAELSFPGTWEP